ncbi:hypothetical protein NDU88_000298 [Pleurodeles waltl]|uniref:Restriction endonuclease type IV Mrr domain-containing protein n=1 Tax=Pleurodeles waltl TaxID=8319 RepID=A0AAV7UQN6_PLEWA|nr:hypothetical protein NDU88_000298 [Pleurodeles waltl]
MCTRADVNVSDFGVQIQRSLLAHASKGVCVTEGAYTHSACSALRTPGVGYTYTLVCRILSTRGVLIVIERKSFTKAVAMWKTHE